MSQAIVITSGKGGVGKTTLTTHLGGALSLSGKNVLLIDGDVSLRNLDASLGLQDYIVFDIIDVIEKNVDLSKAVINHPTLPGLDFLPAPQGKDVTMVSPENMAFLVETAKKIYDVILIDCPAGVDEGFLNCITPADIAIIVTTPDVSAVRDAIKAKRKLEALQKENIWLFVNRARMKLAKKGGCMKVEQVQEFMGIPLLGYAAESQIIIKAGNYGKVAPNNKIFDIYFEMTEKLLDIL